MTVQKEMGKGFNPVTYSGRFGDWYTGLGTQTLMPEKYFSSFLFSVLFQQKIC